MQRLILIIIGWIAVVLATLGVVLLYRSWFGGYLRFWQQHKAMPRGAKPRAILFILVTFAVSLWVVKMVWVRILLLTILGCLLVFMWRLPVIDEKQQNP